MQKMVSLFSYELGPSGETRFVRLGYSLLEESAVRDFKEFRATMVEQRANSAVESVRVLPLTHTLELNQENNRHPR